MKRIAIIQPYFFPYIGYYQLVNCADEIVFLDDSNFTRKGFIRRNSIVVNGSLNIFTLPVHKVSINKPINEHYYIFEKKDFLNLILEGYKKAINYHNLLPIIKDIIFDNDQKVSVININSIGLVFKILGMQFKYHLSSDILPRGNYKKEAWIIEICKLMKATNYINPPGGKDLYDFSNFKSEGITLEFLEPQFLKYPQISNSFIQGLSMIDILMNSNIYEIKEMLKKYKIKNGMNI